MDRDRRPEPPGRHKSKGTVSRHKYDHCGDVQNKRRLDFRATVDVVGKRADRE
jgi:hypothetical protein